MVTDNRILIILYLGTLCHHITYSFCKTQIVEGRKKLWQKQKRFDYGNFTCTIFRQFVIISNINTCQLPLTLNIHDIILAKMGIVP